MHDGLEHSMSVDWDWRRRFESPRGQMCFSTFYKNKNTIKDVDHPYSACAKCIKNRLYDPDPCEVCSQWLKHIKENSVEAESSGSRWVKWNRSLVSAWKHNTVPNYLVPGVDMLIWADTEKFALWKFLLPVTGRRPATDRPPLLKMHPLCQTPALW